MKRVGGVRDRNDLVGKMSETHRQIFGQACRDLLDADPQDNQPQFFLSPSVVEEITTYPDSDLPRYLVHRYWYEIYPKRKIFDEYPPYL